MDAMQDVFVRLLRNQERLEERGLSSLLYRIATNVCLNRLRTISRHPEDAQSELLSAIASLEGSAYETSETRSLLARIFSTQTESTAAIAVLHWVDGMTLQEVASEVNMSVSGVRKRLAKVKAELEKMNLATSVATIEEGNEVRV